MSKTLGTDTATGRQSQGTLVIFPVALAVFCGVCR